MEQADKKITIYEIAKEAGVSPATVSRVLTGNAKVKQEKKEKVLELIKKYHFKPSAVARGLSDTKSRIIGIIAADIRNTYYADMYVACENAANKRGYSVMLMNSFGRIDMEIRQLGKLVQWRADAIIQMGGAVDDLNTDPSYAKEVNRLLSKVPIVVTGKLDNTSCYQVQIDAVAAMDMLVQHLVSNGNKKIALVGGRLDVESTYVKYNEFLKLTGELGLENSPLYTDNFGGYGIEEGAVSMNELFDRFSLAGKPLPEAVICINDSTAAGVIRSIRKHGLRIPEDIAVVSYDNTDLCEVAEPGLTSVAYDYEKYGQALVNTAIDVADGHEADRHILIKPSGLMVRKSSNYKR
ncbi:MAG: LacI family transcriptional regulator [Butyrivibrio sp.]|uniref:LacI family DNA-binding transcriptional regulator n=1 Tax=Butyrivibrio sp. TaxID=28121 RepID=UPI0025F5EE5C|nr:LacI family DNA-binding transcriptional regulator [Butyrivibrio sp.]MCR5769849.1 LacI family transcriptional regulator [Butyrivibrio sp.]